MPHHPRIEIQRSKDFDRCTEYFSYRWRYFGREISFDGYTYREIIGSQELLEVPVKTTNQGTLVNKVQRSYYKTFELAREFPMFLVRDEVLDTYWIGQNICRHCGCSVSATEESHCIACGSVQEQQQEQGES